MRSRATRRTFLGAAGVTVGLGSSLGRAEDQPAPAANRSRPRLAAVTSVYHYLSHAYHIVGRFLDGFAVHDGHGLHRPDFEVAHVERRVEDGQPWTYIVEAGPDACRMSLEALWARDDRAEFVRLDWDCLNLGRFSPE